MCQKGGVSLKFNDSAESAEWLWRQGCSGNGERISEALVINDKFQRPFSVKKILKGYQEEKINAFSIPLIIGRPLHWSFYHQISKANLSLYFLSGNFLAAFSVINIGREADGQRQLERGKYSLHED